jgi:hypothetical protein
MKKRENSWQEIEGIDCGKTEVIADILSTDPYTVLFKLM